MTVFESNIMPEFAMLSPHSIGITGKAIKSFFNCRSWMLPLLLFMFKEMTPFDDAIFFLFTINCAMWNVRILQKMCLNTMFFNLLDRNPTYVTAISIALLIS